LIEIADRRRLRYLWATVYAPMIAWQMDGEPGFPWTWKGKPCYQ